MALKDILTSLIRMKRYGDLVLMILGSIALFIIGIAAFVVMTTVVALVLSLISAVFVYRITPVKVGVPVDSFPEAVLVTIAGILLLALVLYGAGKGMDALRNNVCVRLKKTAVKTA